MGAWGFVFLAYGIVWGTIVVYLVLLEQRLRRAEARLKERSAAAQESP
jgi:CcmD family protein